MRYVLVSVIVVYDTELEASVRSTNVYEENSLGVFNEEDSIDEENFTPSGTRATIWSQYLGLHARKQLSFGGI